MVPEPKSVRRNGADSRDAGHLVGGAQEPEPGAVAAAVHVRHSWPEESWVDGTDEAQLGHHHPEPSAIFQGHIVEGVFAADVGCRRESPIPLGSYSLR